MRRFFCRFVLYLAVSFAGAGVAQEPANRPLSITVVVTARGEELFRSWDRPSGKPFSAVPVKVANRGQFLSAVVLFKGCTPDPAGNCNVEMDITAYDPRRRTYGEMPKVELWQAKSAPQSGFTQLSRTFMGIVIEPNDLSGTYRVTVVARDLNSGATTSSEASFTVK